MTACNSTLIPRARLQWTGTLWCVALWHPHQKADLPGPSAAVDLALTGLPASTANRPVLLQHFRIDRDHSNAFETWKRLGSLAVGAETSGQRRQAGLIGDPQ